MFSEEYMLGLNVIRILRARVRANQRDYTRARGCQLNCLIIVETKPLINPSLTSDP